MIWIGIVLAALGVALLVESQLFRNIEPVDDAEKAFRDYLREELHKAEAGAANAEEWAVQLISEWRRRGHL